jgi:pilus assembly protein TadC
MTEIIGLSLGSLSFAVMLRGSQERHTYLVIFGIFLLTLALNARAGAFIVLPALILWGTWFFRGCSRFSVRFLINGFTAVALGFLINFIILKTTISSENTSIVNANYSYALYQLAVNSKKWYQIWIDYPEA